jgi:hypothetical protein
MARPWPCRRCAIPFTTASNDRPGLAPVLRPAVTQVGGGLPPMAVGQQPRYRLSRPHRGASPLHRFDVVELSTLVPGSVARFYIHPKASGNQGGRGLAPDNSGSATQVSTEQAPSGASPSHSFDGVDLSTVAPGSVARFYIHPKTSSNQGGRGLAPDSSGSAAQVSTEQAPSGASPLHRFDGVDLSAVAPGSIARFYTDPKASGNQGGRGLAPDSSGSAAQVSTEQAPSGASPLPQF